MKQLFTLITIALFLPQTIYAQAVEFEDFLTSAPKAQHTDHSYSTEQLTDISNQLFAAGNPKYIWVDLLKDGYIPANTSGYIRLKLYLYTEQPSSESTIPASAQKAYVEKWIAFTRNIGEPLYKYGFYYFNLFKGFNAMTMLQPDAPFMQKDQAELHDLHLTYSGRLALYQQLLTDRYAQADKPLDLEFNYKGFYVNGLKLSKKERKRYSSLLVEQFGRNYYDDQSSMAIGMLPDKALGTEIQELENRINAVRN